MISWKLFQDSKGTISRTRGEVNLPGVRHEGLAVCGSKAPWAEDPSSLAAAELGVLGWDVGAAGGVTLLVTVSRVMALKCCCFDSCHQRVPSGTLTSTRAFGHPDVGDAVVLGLCLCVHAAPLLPSTRHWFLAECLQIVTVPGTRGLQAAVGGLTPSCGNRSPWGGGGGSRNCLTCNKATAGARTSWPVIPASGSASACPSHWKGDIRAHDQLRNRNLSASRFVPFAAGRKSWLQRGLDTGCQGTPQERSWGAAMQRRLWCVVRACSPLVTRRTLKRCCSFSP